MTKAEPVADASAADQLIEMYRQMHRIRAFELTVLEAVNRGLVAGGPHLYVGEEAVAVGVCTALETRRLHHQHASRPRPSDRQRGPAQADAGRDLRQGHRLLQGQGRLHAHRRLWPGHPRRERHRGRGDPDGGRRGAVQPAQARWLGRGLLLRGRRHQPGLLPRVDEPRLGLEAARDLRLREQRVRHVHPAEASPRRAAISASRAVSYGMPGVQVDGNDVLAVYEATARPSGGRWRAKDRPSWSARRTASSGTTSEIRRSTATREEVEAAKMNDPLPRFKRFLAETGVMDDALDQQIQSEIQQEADEAARVRHRQPRPRPR